MKAQNKPHDWRVLFLLMVAFFIIVVGTSKISESSYTQSDVSALIKFNASEFGCVFIEPTRNASLLSIKCYSVYKNMGDWVNSYKMCAEGDKEVCELLKPYEKTLTYFPQFDGVKIELEPERQKCWNESRIIQTNFNDPYFSAKYNFVNCKKDDMGVNYCSGDKEQYGNCDYLGLGNWQCNKTIVEQKCKTIPAVEKEINPWAVDESDLATEFCRAKTYETNVVNETKRWEWYLPKREDCYGWLNEEWNGNGTMFNACMSNLDNLFEMYSNKETKPFTRGEVVVKKTTYPLGWGYYIKKQKVIRCIGDDSTQKDFDVFGGK